MSFDPSSVPAWRSQHGLNVKLERPSTKCIFDLDPDYDPHNQVVGVIFEMCYPPVDGSKVSFEIANIILSFEVTDVELLIRSKDNEGNSDVEKKILLSNNNDPWSFIYVIKLKVWTKL